MTSHREAPSISTDPVADNTDLYAFVSPDAPDTVTFIKADAPSGNHCAVTYHAAPLASRAASISNVETSGC